MSHARVPSHAPPVLTAPVNDFANVISNADKAEIEKHIRALFESTGDVVVVATVESTAPYADIREYAVTDVSESGTWNRSEG